MSETTESTFTGVQRFLSVVSGYAIPHIYQQGDFLVVFPPELIMELITDADLRAKILHQTMGTNLIVGAKKTATSAGEDLKIALEANVTIPEKVLELFGPDDRVRYLDHRDLWAFIVSEKFWETEDAHPMEKSPAKRTIALMLSTALELDLITPEELVEAIEFEVLLEKETKADLIHAVKLITIACSNDGYRILIGMYSPDRIVQLVPLQLIWEKVIHPLVAKRHGLVTDTQEVKSQTGSPSSRNFQEVVQPEIEDVLAKVPESSPIVSPTVAEADPKKRNLGSSTFGGPLAFSGRASSVPASRVSASSVAPAMFGKEGEPTDPKESKASDSSDSDVTDGIADIASENNQTTSNEDDETDNVDDSELIQGEDSVEKSESGHEIDVTVSASEASEDSRPDRESVLPMVLRSPSTLSTTVASKTPSSVFPAVRQPPRPSSDPRPLPTDDADIQVEVGYARQTDEDVLAALEEEDNRITPEPIPTGRPKRNTGASQISDEEFINAGGVTRSDSATISEEPSITPVNDKVALCQLLRSKDTGLKLEGINPFESPTHHILVTAIEELDPGLFGDRRQEINESNNLDLGNILCSTLESRSPLSSIGLRALLVTIGCATKHQVTQKPVVSSGSPPPLPSTKTPQPGRLFGRKGR